MPEPHVLLSAIKRSTQQLSNDRCMCSRGLHSSQALVLILESLSRILLLELSSHVHSLRKKGRKKECECCMIRQHRTEAREGKIEKRIQAPLKVADA
jgi:hypothetical protein